MFVGCYLTQSTFSGYLQKDKFVYCEGPSNYWLKNWMTEIY